MTIVSSVLFSADFSTQNEVDPATWSFVQYAPVNNPSYFGDTQIRQNLPSIVNGAAHLTIDSYNPTGPGNSFVGTDIYTQQSFQPGSTGIVFTVVAKLDQAQAGLVGGIFPYALLDASTTDHNEIDTELVSNDLNSLSVNTYANQPLGAGNPQTVPLPPGNSLTQWNTYQMVWLPNEILWYVDGTQVAATTSNVPTGPMSLYLDFWVPAGGPNGWQYAYNPALQPVSTAAADTTFGLDVSSVLVTQNPALTISGTVTGQVTGDTATISPFSGVTITDPNPGQTETVTVTLSATANGTLSNLGGGSYSPATGVYTYSGTAAAVTAALDGLRFTPTAGQVAPGNIVTTTFTIMDTDTSGASATDNATTVVAGVIQPPNTGISIGGNGQFASDANDIRAVLAQGAVVYELNNSRIDIAGTGVTVKVGNADALGLTGSGNTANVSGTGSEVWIGGNGPSASNANDDVVMLKQGGLVTALDNSRVDVSGNGVTVFVGNMDALGLPGSGETAIVSGVGSAVWIGGNGQSASNANDDHVTLAQGGVVFESDFSRVDVAGNGVTVNVGNTDALGLVGSGVTANITGLGSGIWIGGNGQSASDANDDHVTLAQSGLNDVTELDNSRIDVTGNGAFVTLGTNDSLGLIGSADTVLFVGTNSALWIGGNGQTASDANDDHVTSLHGGVVTELDSSRIDVGGTGVTVNVGNRDTLGLVGNGDTANVFGIGSSVWIGGNGSTASDANDDYATFAQGGTATVVNHSRVNITGNGLQVNVGVNDTLGLVGSGDTVTITDGSSAVWIGGNGQNATDANNNHVMLVNGGVVTELDNSRVDVSGASQINLGHNDRMGFIANSGTIGFISGSQDLLGVSALMPFQIVSGFNMNHGDQIDLTNLLSGVSLMHDLSNLGNYVFVDSNGTYTELQISGPGGFDKVTLSSVGSLSLSDLINGNAFILPPH